MPFWRRYLRFFGSDVEGDVRDEMDFHFDRLVEDLVARGLSPAEARERARTRMGNTTAAHEECVKIGQRRERRTDWVGRLTGLGQDLHYAARALARTPMFTAVAVLTLGLGVGANAGLFSVVDGVLLRPLPYGEPDRLVMIWEDNVVRDRHRNVANPANVADWRRRATSFDAMAPFVGWSLALVGPNWAERVSGALVTPNFFDVLRARPMLGRGFVAADADSGAARVIVLSYGLWRRRFGADPQIVGSHVRIAGGTVQVVGVMPRGFRPMINEEYWEPYEPAPERHGRYLQVVARLKPGVTVERANVEIGTIAEALAQEYPDFNAGWSARVVPLLDDVVGDARTALLIAFGAVALVLVIAAANVGNLLLIRAVARRHEMSIRAALGVSRLRVMRLWLIECGLLTSLGMLLGVAFAWASVHAIVAIAPPDLPRLDAVRLDTRVLGYAAVMATVIAAALGLGAAFGASSPAPASLRSGSSRLTAGARTQRLRHALVVTQVALALVLLAGAGLLVRTLQRLNAVDPGFDPAHVLVADIALPSALYPDSMRRNAFFYELVTRLRNRPGVEDAGVVAVAPLGGVGYATSFRAMDRPEPAPGQEPVADIRAADAGYFHALRIPLVRGRLMTPDDGYAPRVVVNQALARQMWPNQDPLGKELRVAWYQPEEAVAVIGVVGDTPSEGLDKPVRPMIYYTLEAGRMNALTVVMRGNGDAEGLPGELRAVLRQMDPAVPMRGVEPLADRVSASLSSHRSPAVLLSLFAVLALVLAGVGLYGVLAYAVGLRAREIGVRMALGAAPGQVMWTVVWDGISLTALGLGIGLVGALAATRVLASLLYNTSPADPVTMASGVIVLIVAALLASAIPAMRATHIDPVTSLRAE